jgi:hypothetical protein
MGKVTIITNLIAALSLVGGAARAESPKHLYGATTQSYGPAAVVQSVSKPSAPHAQPVAADQSDDCAMSVPVDVRVGALPCA